jgi:deazaflavin-dependent oxidoreductase (nitroreductase family)
MAGGSDRVRDAVRTFNKHVLNPAMMRLAGHKYWYAAVIRHTGRNSGRRYSTPVVAERLPDGFILPLPYGTRVDWLLNVQASGRAAITANGRTYDVCDPIVIDAAASRSFLSARRQHIFDRFGVTNFLKVRTVS